MLKFLVSYHKRIHWLLIGLFLVALAVVLLEGSASLAPGADPIVVRTEQAETTARSTFKTVLLVDDGNRPWFASNAAPFHDFCSWLREPVEYSASFGSNGLPAGVQLVPRNLAMVLSVDDIKLAYKAGSASSNTLYATVLTLETFADKGLTLLRSATNSTAFHP